MAPSERLEQARLRINKSEREVAAATGMKVPSYYDLESYENELAIVLSLKELCNLCHYLNISPVELFVDEPDQVTSRMDFAALAEQVRSCLEQQHLSVPELEHKVGWTLLGEFLNDPNSAWEWSSECLNDVCRTIGVDWLAVLNGISPQKTRHH